MTTSYTTQRLIQKGTGRLAGGRAGGRAGGWVGGWAGRSGGWAGGRAADVETGRILFYMSTGIVPLVTAREEITCVNDGGWESTSETDKVNCVGKNSLPV